MDLSSFASLLGIAGLRESAETAELQRVSSRLLSLLEDWEQLPATKLARLEHQIFKVASALDSVADFSPVASAVMAGAKPPRAAINWEEELVLMLPSDTLRRVNAIGGKTARACMALQLISDTNRGAGASRWERLDGVKKWLIAERVAHPAGSRAAFIRQRLSEVRERARAAGEPLSGDDASLMATTSRWLREAALK